MPARPAQARKGRNSSPRDAFDLWLKRGLHDMIASTLVVKYP